MPELPEVETICIGLSNNILNKTISKVDLLTGLSLRKPIPENLHQKLVNLKIVNILRRSKYIQIFLEKEIVLLIHLGMSGKLLLKDSNYTLQKHDHLQLILSDQQYLIYNDPRRFGLIELINANALTTHPLLASLGIEPLSKEFSQNKLQEVLAGKKSSIKQTLMNNKFIVGIGNIYASESLYKTAVSPLRASESLNLNEINLLHKNIVEVLNKAISSGGSSLRDYENISGEKGFFQNTFNVYGRNGLDCLKCSTKIVKITQAGRSSFYCPSCQK